MNLSDRQKQLIIAIINEFMKSAEAVGSENLKDGYDLKLSAATIRNELADLVDAGYLSKLHSSSGRIPTALAWKYYINDVMNEELIDPLFELTLREKVFQNRFSLDRLLKFSLDSLSEKLGYTTVGLVKSMIKENEYTPAYISGSSYLLEHREFSQTDKLKDILIILENSYMLERIYNQSQLKEDVTVLIGDEIGIKDFDQLSTVFTKFNLGRSTQITIGVIGPARMNYARCIPAIRVAMKNIKDATIGW